MRKRIKKIETDEQWIKRKASQARSSWLARAKRLEIEPKLVPTKDEIVTWLTNNQPVTCYLSKSEISKDVVELDHKDPISRDGSFNLSNVGITSKWYNQAKGDMTEKEFKSLLKAVSKWECKGKRLFSRLVSSNNRFSRRKK